MGVMQPSFKLSGKYPCWVKRLIRWHSIGDIVCLDSISTEVAIEFAVLPLSFKLSIMGLISSGITGNNAKFWSILSFR